MSLVWIRQRLNISDSVDPAISATQIITDIVMKKILHFLVALALSGLTFQSCQKDAIITDEEIIPSIPQQELLLMDSTYLYTYTYSLWNKNMPEPKTTADLRNFTSTYKSAEEVLAALVALTPPLGPNNNPVDRFSFIDRTNRVGEQIGQGVYRDLGLSLQAILFDETSREVGILIRLVQKNSPAAQSGLKRGLRVLSVDGVALNLTAAANNSIAGNIDVVNKLYTGNVSHIRVRNLSSGAEQDVAITGSAYTLNPILENKVIELPASGKKVGYLAYTSFVSVFTNQQPNNFHRDLTTAFEGFSNAGIQELVVDLRYNGGGETSAAQLLTNLIVPAGHNGQIMYSYMMNEILTAGGFTDPARANAPFQPVKINKTNALSLNRVYFLVTSSSASASELVINALKPYMDVQIISTQGRGTYGKPVGSFGRSVMSNSAIFYITSFKMTNAAGQGDYYNGLLGQKSNSRDGYLDALGSENEQMLSDALFHISNGVYRSTSTSAQARIDRGQSVLNTSTSLDMHLDMQVQGLYLLDK